MTYENREHKRVFLPSAITLKISDRIIRGSECQNISLGGMYVQTKEEIIENEKGSVTLTIKCGKTFETFQAGFHVVWTDPNKRFAAGISFSDVDSKNHQSLENIIHHQMFV